MEILSRETLKILAEKQVVEAVNNLLENENIKEMKVVLLSGKTITVKRLSI